MVTPVDLAGSIVVNQIRRVAGDGLQAGAFVEEEQIVTMTLVYIENVLLFRKVLRIDYVTVVRPHMRASAVVLQNAVQ